MRLDYYAHVLESAVDPLSVARRSVNAFDADIRWASLGPVSVVRAEVGAHQCKRGKREISNSTQRNFHLIMNVASSWELGYQRPARLRAGDAVLVDSELAFAMDWPPFHNVHLKLPASWLSRWLSSPRELTGRVIEYDSGWGSALCAFLAQLSPEFASRPPLPPDVITDHLGVLLTLVAEEAGCGPVCATRTEVALVDRIRDHIVQCCTQPSFGPSDVAEELNISTRTIHRALAAIGKTFSSELMKARIDLAIRMLTSRQFRRLTTAEIGRRSGFSDASHFSRAFRRVTGRAPSQIRNKWRT